MIDPLSPFEARENSRDLVEAFRSGDCGDVLPHNLFRRIAEDAFSPTVPAPNDPIQVFADDGIVRRLNDGGQPFLQFRGPSLFCNIVREAAGVDEPAVLPIHARSDGYVSDGSILAAQL